MKLSFSYVVLRYMHDVFTREFVNIGVVVYCPGAGFLRMKGVKRLQRALNFFPGMDRSGVVKSLRFMESQFASYLASGQPTLPFETWDAAAIARAIIPADDSSLQWSVVGGGVTARPEQVLEELFERMVARHEDKHPPFRRGDADVWQPLETALQLCNRDILSKLEEKELSAGCFRHRFDHVLQLEHGPLHLLLPLSFDLVDPSGIVDKAVHWNARFRQLRKATPRFKAFLLIGKPSEATHQPAYEEARGILESEVDADRTIAGEDQAGLLVENFSRSVLAAN